MITPIDSCGIILSYKCQLGCKHCLSASGPEWKDWMSGDDLSALLSGIRTVWERYPPDSLSSNILFQGIHFAGGEPFLNFPLLLDAVRKTKELNLWPGYVETNAACAEGVLQYVMIERQMMVENPSSTFYFGKPGRSWMEWTYTCKLGLY